MLFVSRPNRYESSDAVYNLTRASADCCPRTARVIKDVSHAHAFSRLHGEEETEPQGFFLGRLRDCLWGRNNKIMSYIQIWRL